MKLSQAKLTADDAPAGGMRGPLDFKNKLFTDESEKHC